MKRLRINEDIRPLSEFRTGIASFLKKTHDTKRPLVITQHGKGVAVLLGVDEYESMQAQDNITAAENWVDTVFAKVEHLKSLPESGRIVPEINNPKIREIIYRNYRILPDRGKTNLYSYGPTWEANLANG